VCYYFCGLWFFFDDLTMKFFGLFLSLFFFFAFFSSQTLPQNELFFEHTHTAAEEESKKRERKDLITHKKRAHASNK